MAFISDGLKNGGRTAHYQISYDDALSAADGLGRAAGLLDKCEADFGLMASWFVGIPFVFRLPVPVQVANASGGASWQPIGSLLIAAGETPTVTLNPGSGSSVTFLRYLLVSEVTEMFMASQVFDPTPPGPIGSPDKPGWFEPIRFLEVGNEGSKGEGLSTFLGAQFLIANGLAPGLFKVLTPLWINSARADFVNNNPGDIKSDATTGCTTLFLYYLHDQLGYSIQAIIAAAADTLGGVYQNLTGKSDGWNSFIDLVNKHYPPSFTYVPPTDSIFPVPEIAQFLAPNPLTTGYTQSTQIRLDRNAPAEVNVQLTSESPALQVPGVVTIPPGSISAPVTLTDQIQPLPFSPIKGNVRANYAGRTLTITAQVVMPRITHIRCPRYSDDR